MRRFILSKIGFAVLLAAGRLQAQETGAGAVSSSDTAVSSTQNWIFAGSALITAVIGYLVVSINEGKEAH